MQGDMMGPCQREARAMKKERGGTQVSLEGREGILEEMMARLKPK